MAKGGKYFGPDKNKGVRPTGKDQYYGPNQYKGVRPDKKKSGGGGGGGGSLMTQAKKLGKGKYAPVLKELEMNEGTNTKLYTNAGTQRKSAIDREIGSINAAGATSKKTIGDLGAGNQSAYQTAIAQSQSSTKELLDKVGTTNSNMLSSLQAEIKARGGSEADYAYLSPLTRDASQTTGTLAAVGEIGRSRLESQKGLDQTRTTSLQAMADMMQTTGASKARGAAQANFDELYTKWLARKDELETAKAKTKLEKGDYINQTYLTLKEKAAQAKAEKAQAALQASIAQGNLNYKYEALGVNTQKAYDQMAAKKTQNDLSNELRARGLTLQESKAVAGELWKKKRFDFDVEKFNWKKNQPKTGAAAGLSPATLALLADMSRQ